MLCNLKFLVIMSIFSSFFLHFQSRVAADLMSLRIFVLPVGSF